MQAKRFGDKVIFRLDEGEEIIETIEKICNEFKVKLGIVYGFGAVNKIIFRVFEKEQGGLFARFFIFIL